MLTKQGGHTLSRKLYTHHGVLENHDVPDENQNVPLFKKKKKKALVLFL